MLYAQVNKTNNSSIIAMNINQNVDLIYNDLINYSNKKVNIIKNLQNKSPTKYEGYLVEENFVEKWKVHSYYKIFKDKLTNTNNPTELKNFLIQEQVKNNYNYAQTKKNDENLIIKDLNKLKESLLSNKSYVLLDKLFLQSFNNLKFPAFIFLLSN